MRRIFILFLFLLPFLSFGKGIFKREKIELIHIVDRCRVSVVTCCYAYDYMTPAEFRQEFGRDLYTTIKRAKQLRITVKYETQCNKK